MVYKDSGSATQVNHTEALSQNQRAFLEQTPQKYVSGPAQPRFPKNIQESVCHTETPAPL
jgi:hypothetical protein